MNDESLLVLAAKAAGMPAPVDRHGCWIAWVGSPVTGHWWNPLSDDGDAFRLAFKLGIRIIWFGTIEEVRRMIVTAAAEIGRSMP